MKSTKPIAGYVASLVVVGLLIGAFLPFRDRVNPMSPGLGLVLAVLLIASIFGSRPAMVTSVVAGIGLNFFFLPPYYTLTINEPQNWIAFFVFLIVAVTVGQLSAKSRERAEVAEKLYDDLQVAFEKASEAEAVRRSEKLKSALLDAVTHDLRTPLTSIKAATTMLIEQHGSVHSTLDPAGHADLLDVINEETDRLNLFVDSMVGLAKIEAGNTDWRKEKVAVEDLIGNVLTRAAPRTGDRKIDVAVEPGLIVYGDERALGEALYNVIDNAAKYSPSGSTIRIASAAEKGSVTISVEDEGNGVDPPERERIFEKFYQGGRPGAGFGLGLAIVKGVVEAHGGRVYVEDGRHGARFVIDLPQSE